MEMDDIIAVIRAHGLSVREIAALTEVPKSTVHRLLKQYDLPVIRHDGFTIDGHKFYMIHFPYTFTCPGCGLEQNHAWICIDCGVFIPAECKPNEVCAKGFKVTQLV